ncbi:hypothetical protein [Noviherbaspirillum sp. ST9]|uniref:hypothetical protein n=1 Tax=Noviherbaspirillum sp. ST9 TaxID=3401606 RepID=UPI003B58A239
MHTLPQTKRALAILFGWIAGALGFLLSLALSITVLVRQGNAGFLIIWLVAVIATAACMRANVRWRKSCERMASPEVIRPGYPARTTWRQSVEDIAFRDIPDTAVSFSQ